MSDAGFNATWEPRVGREATSLIRRRVWFGVAQPVVLAGIVVLAITAYGSRYYAIALPLVGIYLIGFVTLLRRSNRRLATALSRHLGCAVSPGAIPPVRSAKRFDDAVSKLRATAT